MAGAHVTHPTTNVGSSGACAAAFPAPASLPSLWVGAGLALSGQGNLCPWRTAPWWFPRTFGGAGEYGYLAYRPPFLDGESGSIIGIHGTPFNNLPRYPISKASALAHSVRSRSGACKRAATEPTLECRFWFPQPHPRRRWCSAQSREGRSAQTRPAGKGLLHQDSALFPMPRYPIACMSPAVQSAGSHVIAVHREGTLRHEGARRFGPPLPGARPGRSL